MVVEVQISQHSTEYTARSPDHETETYGSSTQRRHRGTVCKTCLDSPMYSCYIPVDISRLSVQWRKFNYGVTMAQLPSVLVFLSKVSYLSHNRLFLDFFYFFSSM